MAKEAEVRAQLHRNLPPPPVLSLTRKTQKRNVRVTQKPEKEFAVQISFVTINQD